MDEREAASPSLVLYKFDVSVLSFTNTTYVKITGLELLHQSELLRHSPSLSLSLLLGRLSIAVSRWLSHDLLFSTFGHTIVAVFASTHYVNFCVVKRRAAAVSESSASRLDSVPCSNQYPPNPTLSIPRYGCEVTISLNCETPFPSAPWLSQLP